MQATGQYGEVPQYVGSRVGASSHGHMFNLSHETSLSSESTTTGQAHAHGHGLSLSHASTAQSHVQPCTSSMPAVAQPLFFQPHHNQQQQQQQHKPSGFNVSMGAVPPKTASTTAPPLASHPPAQAPSQPTLVLQSAVQQIQEDIKQHQLHQLHQTSTYDLGLQQQFRAHEQSIGGDSIQESKQRQPPPAGEEYASARAVESATIAQEQAVSALVHKGVGGEAMRGELADGEEADEEGERGGGGNRWPRQEALALLKIRSEMDTAFRDSSLKGPLWEEVSRKLGEMGYHRSAKKCKEKFENVHKYYKRTKEGKTGRQDGKSYRFFSQLEALYGNSPSLTHLSTIKSPSPTVNPVSNGINNFISNNNNNNNNGLFSSLSADTSSPALGLITAANHSASTIAPGTTSSPVPLASLPPLNASAPAIAAAATAAATNAHITRTLEKVESMKRAAEHHHPGLECFFNSSDEDDDDGDEDDDEDDEEDDDDHEFEELGAHESNVPAVTENPPRGKKRKRNSMRKYLIFFEKVMKKVLDKQEHMQQKFLEALERRDQERMIREEAWKRQEMARLNREHDVRAAEQALSASRDASLVALLQKMTGQSITLPHQYSNNVHLQPTDNHLSMAIVPADYMQNESSADRDAYDPSSKRWPKPEVLALIKLRTSLDQRFHEPGSKAVLWEEISAGLSGLGYSRTAKRCKEKWENINKYFKKAKESNKKRPENAKTCPYFHHLNALYKEGLLGGSGGGYGLTNKQLMMPDKAEERSEGVMDQEGNSTVNHGEKSGLGHGDFKISHRKNVDASEHLMGNEISASEMSNRKLSNLPSTVSTGVLASAVGLSLQTSSTDMDMKMHMFMGGQRQGDIKDQATVMKNGMPSNDMPQPASDLPAGQAKDDSAVTPMTSSLPFSLDRAMTTISRNLPSVVPAIKQGDQHSQT